MAANGSEIPIMGMVTLEATLGNNILQIRALVSEHVCDAMLGVDWLEDQGATWDFARGEIRIANTIYPLKSRPNRMLWSRRVVIADDVTIPASSEMEIPALQQYRHLSGNVGAVPVTWMAEPCVISPGVVSARAVVPDRAVDIPLRVLNMNDHAVTLKKGNAAVELRQAQLLTTVTMPAVSNLPQVVEEMVSRVDSSIPEPVSTELHALLTEYSMIFSCD